MRRIKPVRGRKSLANLLLVVPAFMVMGLLSAGTIWLIQRAQSTRCPSMTFLSGSGQVASIVQIIPVLVASIGFAFLTVNRLAHAVPPIRHFFDRNARNHGERNYERSQRSLARFSFIILAAMAPITIAASFCQYCIGPNGIAYQSWPWSGLRHYSWTDVQEVKTSCTRQRSRTGTGWSASFVFILRDGMSFDIMEWPRSTARAYPDIVRALDGIDFAFDASRVNADCAVPYMNLLIRRP